MNVAVIATALMSLTAHQPVQDSTHYTVAVRFLVTDTTTVFERPLSPSLKLVVRREEGLGWTVAVEDNKAGAEGVNLLYHSRQWHGPYATDVFAWSRAQKRYPDERLLPVYGHPFEIRVRLIGCRTSGTGDATVFVSGTIEVAWRRGPIRPLEGE